MKNELLTPAEAANRIRKGDIMLIAGAERSLQQLPPGNWIGGTSHYLLTTEGGRSDCPDLLCTTIEGGRDCLIRTIHTHNLEQISEGYFDNGFTVILIPGFSAAHRRYAFEAGRLPGLTDQPLIGWVSSVRLEDIDHRTPKVFDGSSGLASTDGIAVMHIELPTDLYADMGVINVYEPRFDPARTFVFEDSGFDITYAWVDGKKVDLASYIHDQAIDTKLPLMAEIDGEWVNVSFRSVSRAEGEVRFYGPVQKDVRYHLAHPLKDYASSFAALDTGDGARQISCNCILNYFYGELEGRTTGSFTSPATFGEIAHVLMNQTLARIEVKPLESSAAA